MASQTDASSPSRSKTLGWPQSELLRYINDLLEARISVPEFESRYYDFYIEQLPENILSDREDEFFGLVQEKLDWTTHKPDKLSKDYGWLNHAEYVDWLRRTYHAYTAGDPLEFL